MPDILTLDVGTTALKAVIFDEAGRLRGRAECEYQPDRPRPGWLELDPEVYWEAAAQAIRQVREAAAPVELCALGVTSQGETLIVLDDRGRPLRPAIVWLDTRSDKEARELEQALDPTAVYHRTGQSEIIPAWPATRIAWLRCNEPEVFQRAARYLLVADYLIYRLTGIMASDRGLNPSTFYYDLTAGCWWDDMLERLGITPAHLPDLVGPGGRVGQLTRAAARETGLPAGLPVISAPIDQVCAAAGAGNIRPGVITENTGAALALAVTLDEPLFDPQRRMGLYAHALPGKYMLLPWAPTAGMALRWLRDELGGGADYNALCQSAATTPPGADGLLMLPHFSGAGCPRVSPEARGVFWGLTLNHGRSHLVRALLESVAFILRGNLEMLDSLGVATGELH
ncbi:MAG: hypothetical protein LC725_05625, partial [Lentisphaerae bacterium]|nr:hypothetical protein [Lentisphaerota bacterium]